MDMKELYKRIQLNNMGNYILYGEEYILLKNDFFDSLTLPNGEGFVMVRLYVL